jgi:cytochrome c oxidase cbb3-type subunit 3
LTGIGLLVLVYAAARYWHLRTQQQAIMQSDPDQILADPALRAMALQRGQRVYLAHCASCHGGNGRGSPESGVPDLTDASFLYGSGLPSEIEAIVLHGIRSGDSRGFNLASMPAYARAKPYGDEPIPPLRPAAIADVVQYLRGRQGWPHDPAAASRGEAIYLDRGGCFDCHNRDGLGDPAIGAPNLVGSARVYGGSETKLYRSIAYGRAGRSPAFARFISALDARAVAVYAASLHVRGRASQ